MTDLGYVTVTISPDRPITDELVERARALAVEAAERAGGTLSDVPPTPCASPAPEAAELPALRFEMTR